MPTLWDVQDILAARTSVTGDDEVLVVWKPSWIPFSNVQDGPGLQRFKAAPKWYFTSSHCGMRAILPVEANTTLAVDHAVMQEMKAAARSEKRSLSRQVATTATDAARTDGNDRTPAAGSDRTPRKALGCVAKRSRTK
jgi:hypothetical protein